MFEDDEEATSLSPIKVFSAIECWSNISEVSDEDD